MPLLVIPVAPDETSSVTLAEWDLLCSCQRVLFERPDHPLRARLRAAGVPTGAFDDEPSASLDGWGLVADSGSPRVIELARAGALVTSGPVATPDSLTAAHGASVARRGAAELGRLVLIMARLRGPDGCPWDREQTHESLRVHLLEEVHEVLEVIDTGAGDLEEELGDLLLQVVFHAQLAHDDGRFDVSGVAGRIASKLLHRHPHVFGEIEVADANEVVRNWEQIKAQEKQRGGPFEGIPKGLPALLATAKMQKRAASLGFAPTEDEARGNALAALEAGDLGGALFWLVGVGRAIGADPESALRSALARFVETISAEEKTT